VLDVPGRTAIRWHIGNYPRDVLGCSVVGTAVGENRVENSRVAFAALMVKLQGQETIAEYHDLVQSQISLHAQVGEPILSELVPAQE
jgi:hypothetical protein